MPPAIFISAGEASGEYYGALLIASIRRLLGPKAETAEMFGMGGPRMAEAGLERIVRAEDMAVMGITEVIAHLPRIYGGFRKLRQSIRDRRPAAAVLIDFPDIHLKLAAELHRLGIPVIYFVSPQLWAWKKHRIRLVQKFVRRMLVIFPFEEPYYRDRGVQAEFVGHPLAELPQPTVSRGQFAAENRLDPARTWIALLPGSRVKEIRANLPAMLAAARELASLPDESPAPFEPRHENRHENLQRAQPAHGRDAARPRASNSDNGRYAFIVPLAATLNAAQRAEVERMVRAQADGLSIRLVRDVGGVAGEECAISRAAGARAALFHARASVVASGTATVEAALIGNPFVVVYRVSPLTYAVAERVVKVPHVAMANLIAGKRVVPELIQHDFTASNIVQHLNSLLPDGPARQSMMQQLQGVRGALRAPFGAGREMPGVMDRVAAVVLEELEAVPPTAS